MCERICAEPQARSLLVPLKTAAKCGQNDLKNNYHVLFSYIYAARGGKFHPDTICKGLCQFNVHHKGWVYQSETPETEASIDSYLIQFLHGKLGRLMRRSKNSRDPKLRSLRELKIVRKNGQDIQHLDELWQDVIKEASREDDVIYLSDDDDVEDDKQQVG